MERMLEQLVEVLEQTKTLYERMLTLILEEKAAATASDFERFSGVSEEKEGLVAQLKQTEQRRNTILRTLSATLDIPLQQLNVSTLVTRVDVPYRVKLKTVASALESSVSRVRIANRECCMIIEHCLGLVTRSMGFFQHWLQVSSVYGQSGNLCTGNRSGGRLVSGTV